MKTKILVRLLALICLLPLAAKAQLTYITNDNTITITGYTGSPTNIIIPDNINGFPVVSIGAWAFYFCNSLRNVTIPNSVTSIGDAAFYGCESLTNVTIPNSVTNIGDGVFYWCYSLTNIAVDESNPSYSSVNGVLFDKEQTLLIKFPNSHPGTNYVIPGSVVNIADGAFYRCTNLVIVSIGNSATNIGRWTFLECAGLKDVTIGNSVTSIGLSVFYGCISLTNVTIPNSVTDIGSNVFSSCISLANVTIPNGVTNIGNEAFYSCISLTNVTIPNSVVNIGKEVFYNCYSLKNVTIPNSVTSIGNRAFSDCYSLTNITFLGNAPTQGGISVFSSTPVIVYYYYGTTGWSATYGGRPTVMLFPPPQIGSGNGMGLQSGNFSFVITGASNQTIVVEASTNLVEWQPVWTNTLSSTSTNFTDTQWTNYPNRFYRVRRAGD